MGMNVESLREVAKEELDTKWKEKIAFQRMDQRAKQKFIKEPVDEQAFLVISPD